MKSVQIWTDGSSRGNPGKGGWAAVIVSDDGHIIVGGHARLVTNNAMETEAVIGGLAKLPEPCDVKIMTDSTYVISGINKVLLGITPATNTPIWARLIYTLNKGGHRISAEHIKAHGPNRYNNMADQVAGYCADSQSEVYKENLKAPEYRTVWVQK